jgi:hypothetical protein
MTVFFLPMANRSGHQMDVSLVRTVLETDIISFIDRRMVYRDPKCSVPWRLDWCTNMNSFTSKV